MLNDMPVFIYERRLEELFFMREYRLAKRATINVVKVSFLSHHRVAPRMARGGSRENPATRMPFFPFIPRHQRDMLHAKL